MYENLEATDIKKDILNYLAHWSTEEGSFADSLAAPIAHEIWKCYQRMDALFPILCLAEDSGAHILERCRDYGIYQREGKKSNGKISLSGTAGTSIASGTAFVWEGLTFFLEETVTLSDTDAVAIVTAEKAGKAYNLEKGAILAPLYAVSGLSGAVAAEDFKGGTDTESTEEMRQRLLYLLQNTPASGNAADYKKWALDISGVQNAIVTPLKNGPGTVEVVLIGEDHSACGTAILERAKTHIEEQRPIGAAVTVKDCTEIPVTVSVTIQLRAEVAKATACTQIENNIKAYFKAFEGGTVYHSRIMSLIMNAEGVENVSRLTVNGGADLILSYDAVPKLENVEVALS